MFSKISRRDPEPASAAHDATQADPKQEPSAAARSSVSLAGRLSSVVTRRAPQPGTGKEKGRHASAEDFLARFGVIVDVPSRGHVVRPKTPEQFDPPLTEPVPESEVGRSHGDRPPSDHRSQEQLEQVLAQERKQSWLLRRLKEPDAGELRERCKKEFDAIASLPEEKRIAASQEVIARIYSEAHREDGMQAGA